MLILKNIIKDYITGDTAVRAMNRISINFRESEFVAILGPSGCGKTTMLNIIGGLDRYSSGDLVINGKSTKMFTDNDWDTYRNHSIGFIFQSYNLIPHQTVLANVELALTLSGVSKKERTERAISALKRVGLEAQMNKRPSQMSGGQMQRVAIARALINDPDIILADEPTGALDSETSVQIMELLKEIANDKLIIMVTHNPDLANEYANRIINLLDGEVVGDSNPFEPLESDYEAEAVKAQEEKAKGKKPSMSMGTAFMLSLRNLFTKRGRTLLTAFAGSIGIIGIALVVALQTGINNYISKVERDALLLYPMSIEREAMDVDSVMDTLLGMSPAAGGVDHELDAVYVNNAVDTMINSFIAESSANNLSSFAKYIEDNREKMESLCNDIQINYSVSLNVYKADTSNGVVKVNPNSMMSELMSSSDSQQATNMVSGFMDVDSMSNIWKQLIGDNESIAKQYDIVYGRLPQNYNDVVLVIDGNNEINDMVAYGLGIKDQKQFMQNVISAISSGEQLESEQAEQYSYEDILNMKFKLVLSSDYMKKDEKTGLWTDMSDNDLYVKGLIEDGIDINIVGIIRPSKDNVLSLAAGSIGYTQALVDYVISENEKSEVVQQQLSDPTTDVITGNEFFDKTVNDFDLVDIDLSEIDMQYLDITPFMSMAENIDMSEIDIMDMSSLFNFTDLTDLQKKLMEGYLDDSQVLALKQAYVDTKNAQSSLSKTYATIGYSDTTAPTSIYLYPKDFDTKAELNDMIDYYNETVTAQGHENYTIRPTDYIGIVMNIATQAINIVSYTLIMFVAISLVVSSIMISIITYVSVIERTKEIGILRAIGASKMDITNVFNAETVIIGFSAGFVGIVVTLLLEIPINLILNHLTGTTVGAVLPFADAVILICISIFLTFVAGLVPSLMAARKDPVEALRTE